MINFEREPQFNPEAKKERVIISAAKAIEVNSDKLDEKQKAAAILALGKFEGGNYSITLETVENIY